jgi:serine-type D-Ala-D-Ala carboxypeptidase (penicillin-binding protein 5/6)
VISTLDISKGYSMVIKKFGYLFFACSVWTLSSIYALTMQQNITAESAILINAKSGRVLYEKQANILSYPASTTKIATALFALACKPNAFQELVTVQPSALRCVSNAEKRQKNWTKYPSYVLQSDASIAGIKPNEVLTYKDLLYGLLLASGDDSSNVIAQYLANGSIETFMDSLNRFLKKLGCQNTHFNNPHGLHNPDHATTAVDMALIAKYALQNKVFREIVKTVSYEQGATNLQPKVTFYQSNKLLRKGPYYYEYAIGVKTGYTECGGNTLVAAAEKDGRTLIAVLFHCKSRGDSFKEAKALFEGAFQEKRIEKNYLGVGKQAFALDIDGAKNSLTTFTKEPLALSYYLSEAPQIKCELVWDERTLPIQAGQKVGMLRLVDNNEVYAEAALYAQVKVEETWLHTCTRLCSSTWGNIVRYWPLSLIALGLLMAIYFFLVSKKRASRGRSHDSRRY